MSLSLRGINNDIEDTVMTKKLAETLNLADPEDMVGNEPEDIRNVDDVLEEAELIKEELATTDKIDNALASVESLQQHDIEMDDIAEKALQSYKDLCDLSMNMQDNYVARLYEVSNGMLNTALKARDSKINRKLKTIELQMKKMKLDRDVGGEDPRSQGSAGTQLDRNELLKLIKNSTDKK